MATQETDDRRRPSAVHVVSAIALLVVHAVLFVVAYMAVALAAMGLDPCGYVQCGDEIWAHRAAALMWYGGLALVVVDVVLTVWRLVKRRAAVLIPIVGCSLHVGLAVAGLVLMSLAGPQ